jgi:hypothetical protein
MTADMSHSADYMQEDVFSDNVASKIYVVKAVDSVFRKNDIVGEFTASDYVLNDVLFSDNQADYGA